VSSFRYRVTGGLENRRSRGCQSINSLTVKSIDLMVQKRELVEEITGKASKTELHARGKRGNAPGCGERKPEEVIGLFLNRESYF